MYNSLRLIVVLLLASAIYAETSKSAPAPAPAPTVEQQLAAKDAQIKWLEQRVAILAAQSKAIADYYAATEALRQSDASKPVEPKPESRNKALTPTF